VAFSLYKFTNKYLLSVILSIFLAIAIPSLLVLGNGERLTYGSIMVMIFSGSISCFAFISIFKKNSVKSKTQKVNEFNLPKKEKKTVKDQTGKKKLNRFLKIMIFSLLIIAGLLVYSYLFPNSRCGYRTLFVDSKTHTYKNGDSFYYGVYKFTISASFRAHNSQMKDCSLENAAGTIATCEAVNKSNLELNSKNDLVDLNFKIENRSNQIQSIPNGWYKFQSAKGVNYFPLDFQYTPGVYGDTTNAFDFVTTSILPHTTRERSTESTLIEKNDNPVLIVTLPGLAPQIVDLRQS
jgi:hypothetical protein